MTSFVIVSVFLFFIYKLKFSGSNKNWTFAYKHYVLFFLFFFIERMDNILFNY